MRALIGFVALGLYAVSSAQKASFDAIQGGKNVGSLSYERKISGGKQTTVVNMVMKQGAQSVNIKITSIYDAKGAPASRMGDFSAQGQTGKVAVIFKGTSATVTATAQGKTQTKVIKATGSAPLADPSIWWFVTHTPKVGESQNYQTFSPINLQWTEVKVRYVGPGLCDVNGKKVSAYKVEEIKAGQTSTVWLDAKGMPLMLDEGPMKFIRKG